MARRTVEKCFGELVADGVVESAYRGYTVLDMAVLRQIAGLPAANPH